MVLRMFFEASFLLWGLPGSPGVSWGVMGCHGVFVFSTAPRQERGPLEKEFGPWLSWKHRGGAFGAEDALGLGDGPDADLAVASSFLGEVGGGGVCMRFGVERLLHSYEKGTRSQARFRRSGSDSSIWRLGMFMT